MPTMFDVNRFCKNKECEKNVSYVKQQTSGNNPNISQKMRYSEFIRQNQTMKTK
jgi:hypothetical protein